MRRIKILIIIGALDIGGAEGQVYELAKGLDKQRFELVICSLVNHGVYIPKIRQLGIRVETITERMRYVPLNLHRLIQLIKQEKFDIVHNVLFTSELFGTFAAKYGKVPVIINSIRSMGFLRYKNRRPIKKMLYNVSDITIANSNLLKNTLIAYNLANEHKIKVIYNGVDTDKFSQRSISTSLADGNRSFNIPSRDIRVVGAVASLTPVKNHICLLHAIPSILEEVPKTIFLIIGNGALKPMLEKESRDLQIRKNIFFTGNRDDTANLLAAMDLSVLCSVREGFANVILESMACGTPVIASNVGGNGEAVQHGVSGFLFESNAHLELADRVKKLLREEVLRQQMGIAARQRVTEYFSLQKMLTQYHGLYDSLMALKS